MAIYSGIMFWVYGEGMQTPTNQFIISRGRREEMKGGNVKDEQMTMSAFNWPSRIRKEPRNNPASAKNILEASFRADCNPNGSCITWDVQYHGKLAMNTNGSTLMEFTSVLK